MSASAKGRPVQFRLRNRDPPGYKCRGVVSFFSFPVLEPPVDRHNDTFQPRCLRQTGSIRSPATPSYMFKSPCGALLQQAPPSLSCPYCPTVFYFILLHLFSFILIQGSDLGASYNFRSSFYVRPTCHHPRFIWLSPVPLPCRPGTGTLNFFLFWPKIKTTMGGRGFDKGGDIRPGARTRTKGGITQQFLPEKPVSAIHHSGQFQGLD